MAERSWLRAVPSDGAQPQESPEQLLRLVALGDEAAFERLYPVLAPLVYGMAVQTLRNPALAEEVAQEVLVEVWRTASRFDPARGSARSWVVTMTRRRAIDRVRAVHAADERDLRVAASTTDRDVDTVSEEVHTRLEQVQVRRCLDGLTDLQRHAVGLTYYRGLTQQEVATMLEVPVGTIKTRLRDGLIRLRDCLGVA